MKLEQIEKEAAADFWLWMIKEVKPDVIDGEEFIECHGFKSKVNLVPVMSLKQLIDMWYGKYLVSEGGIKNKKQQL